MRTTTLCRNAWEGGCKQAMKGECPCCTNSDTDKDHCQGRCSGCEPGFSKDYKNECPHWLGLVEIDLDSKEYKGHIFRCVLGTGRDKDWRNDEN